jgi:hypothetical protein
VQKESAVSVKPCILIADLDDASRSAVEECLPSNRFEIRVLSEPKRPALPGRVDLVIFRSANDLEQTEKSCEALRSHVGQNVPIIVCVGRYVYPLIRPLHGNAVQSMIITPFNAAELRQWLDELDLGF